MNKSYATAMWTTYLKLITDPAEDLLIDNPLIRQEKLKNHGFFFHHDQRFYADWEKSARQEESLFKKKWTKTAANAREPVKKASVCALFMRMLQHLDLTDAECETIAETLAQATTRVKHFSERPLEMKSMLSTAGMWDDEQDISDMEEELPFD